MPGSITLSAVYFQKRRYPHSIENPQDEAKDLANQVILSTATVYNPTGLSNPPPWVSEL